MNSGIYRISAPSVTDKIYIGSSYHMRRRKNEHIARLRRGAHSNPIMQGFFDKYGLDCLVFEVVEYCPREELMEREQIYLDDLNPLFNIKKIAACCIGASPSDETNRKRAESIKRTWANKSEEEMRELSERYVKAQNLDAIPAQVGRYILKQIASKRGRYVRAQCVYCYGVYDIRYRGLLNRKTDVCKCQCQNIIPSCKNIRPLVVVKKIVITCQSNGKKSGYVGIYWSTKVGKWRAKVKRDNVGAWLGYYRCPDEANRVRLEYIDNLNHAG